MPGKQDGAHKNSRGTREMVCRRHQDSTHPREGLFNQDAKTIARELASKKVSPKGYSSGMRMLTFYINRAGKNLPEKRLKVLEEAKELLHKKIVAGKARAKKSTGQEGCLGALLLALCCATLHRNIPELRVEYRGIHISRKTSEYGATRLLLPVRTSRDKEVRRGLRSSLLIFSTSPRSMVKKNIGCRFRCSLFDVPVETEIHSEGDNDHAIHDADDPQGI